jgi:CDP-glucose 4,6-dehydratase
MSDNFLDVFRGKRVIVTGHTGFKGSWLSLWLARLGANVCGVALPPPTAPAMFDLCGVAEDVDSRMGDIRDLESLKSLFGSVRPDVVLHLAAQAIVRRSYADPIETVTTNVVGTANVLEAVRSLDSPCAVVIVSSDKCYENHEWIWGYRENDPMGGHDPYSMSKGATELVTASWRRSFFPERGPVKLASARAGNVIGGGDWAADRIVPDCIRAFSIGECVELRNPLATRPWQHVLEPLGGYLLLAARLLSPDAAHYCSGWNFGPHSDDVRPVEDVVRLMAAEWGAGANWTTTPGPHPKEAALLALNCDKAAGLLAWRPTWRLEDLVRNTARWYRTWLDDPSELKAETFRQTAGFERDMFARGVGRVA